MVEQLVAFKLGNEHFGINISEINTIIRLPEITLIPNTPKYMLGIINLRGTVVPIFDLRLRLGLPEVESSKLSRIIVAEHGESQIGFIVDAVTETLRVEDSDMDRMSTVMSSMNTEFIRGLGKVDDRIIIILSVDKLFDTNIGALEPQQ